MMIKTHQEVVFDLLAIAVLASIPSATFIIANGFSVIPVITELNASPSFFVSNLLYCWHPYYEAGFDNSSSSWFFFPLGLLFAALSSIGVGISMISILFVFIVYLLHGFSMYYLMSIIGRIEESIPRSSKIMAASFYMLNPLTLLYMHELGSQQLLASATLPLLLAFLIQGLQKKKLVYCIYIGLVSIFAGANITFFIISVLVLLAYAIYDLIQSHGTNFFWKLTFVAIMLATILASNVFWVLPRFSNLTAEISAAFREGESVSRSIVLNSLSSSYYETFRLMGSWAFQPAYFSYYSQYYSPLIIAATFAVPIFAMASLTLRPRRKFEIFAAVMIVVCLPLAVATYPVSNPHLTGRIYIWLYQNLPFFIIFRGAYKFVMVIALFYSGLIGLTWAKLAKLKPIKARKSRNLIVLVIISFLLLGSMPSFLGQIVEKEKNFNIPQYYYEAANWLESQGKNFRILTTPEMRHVQYTWNNETKFTGTDVAIPIFKIPIVGRSYYLSLGSESTDDITHQLYRMIIANQSKDLAHALKILNVRYVMIHGDYKWNALEWNQPPSFIFDVLNTTPNITFVRSFGELHFFENQAWSDSTALVAAMPSNSSLLDLFTFVASDFDPRINVTTSNWKNESGLLTSNDLYNYEDDIVLNEKGYTNLTMTFNAKSSNGYLHICFFAKDEKNCYRMWLNDTQYELDKIVDGKSTIIKSQEHNLSVSISSWNRYEVEPNEGGIRLSVNGSWLCIDHENRDYIGGKIGFASTTNIVQISNARLRYLIVGVNSFDIRSCSYVRFNPAKCVVSLQNISKPVFLVFTDSFHEGWQAYMEENQTAKLQHVESFNYANGWYTNRTGDYKVTLEYAPQAVYELGFNMWFLVITAFLAFLAYYSRGILYELCRKLIFRLKRKIPPKVE